MNKNERFVIAINRELGTGGRIVGQKLAERLQVPFYDKAVIQGLQKKFSLSTDEIERLKAKKSNWWTDILQTFVPTFERANISAYYHPSGKVPDSMTTEEMYHAETEILKEVAAEGSCIITGRSAFYIFKDHPNHLNILIQASLENRIARLMRKKNLCRERAMSIIDEVDKGREQYIHKYTGVSRYDARYYQLVINMDNITEDQAVDLILSYINSQSK